MNILFTGCKNDCKIKGKRNNFARKNKEFSLENFKDGYVNNDGRFMVYYPKSKRSYRNGYILRSIAAYELYHNISIDKNYDIHHLNNNKLDDSIENLIKLSRDDHNYFHAQLKRKKSLVEFTCKNCEKIFYLNKYRLREKSRGSYCCLKCYHISRKKI